MKVKAGLVEGAAEKEMKWKSLAKRMTDHLEAHSGRVNGSAKSEGDNHLESARYCVREAILADVDRDRILAVWLYSARRDLDEGKTRFVNDKKAAAIKEYMDLDTFLRASARHD